MAAKSSGARRALALLLKLALAVVFTLTALELGVRLVAPVDRFEFIPNTFDPVAQIRQAPNVRGYLDTPEYRVELRTNAAGLREDREIPLAKPAGQLRILCLGDSFTVGFGVAREDAFPALIEAALTADTTAVVLNAGVAGTGTAHQLAWFTSAGARWQPDVVLLAPVVNDPTDNTKSGLFTFGPDSALVQHAPVQEPTLGALRLLRRLPGYTTWFARSHLLNAIKQRFAVRHHQRLETTAGGGAAAAEVTRREDALLRALVERLRAECEARGAALVVMPVPALPDSPEESRWDAFHAWLAREEFALVDLRPAFAAARAAGELLYYPRDGHWTAAGHRLAAAGFLAAWTSSASDAGPTRTP